MSRHWPEDERKRDYAFFYLMHVTGARVGSILKLRQSDFGDGYVWAETAKGEKQQIPVRSEAIVLVCELGGDYVFRNRFGRSLGYHGARLILKRALMLAGLDRPGLATHLFRRGFASDCLDDGMDLETLRQLLGHASILQAQEYLYRATDSVKAK